MKALQNFLKTILASIWMKAFAGKGELSSLLNSTAKVIPQALPEPDCQKLIEKIEEVLSGEKHPRVWRDPVGSDSRIWRFEQDVAGLIGGLEIQRWIQAIDDYTGRKTQSWCLMANRLVPIEGNLGSGGGMHRDSSFSHQVKCIWYLSKVESQNGPFQYLPGTNVNLVRDRRQYPLGENRFHGIVSKSHKICADAGSMLICDTKCIHGGKPIEKGVRYAVTLYTFVDAGGVKRVLRKSGLVTE